MNFFISDAHAQGTATHGAAGGGMSFIIMMVVLFGLMYFMMIRPQMKRQKEHRNMLSALAKGDEVTTNGGMAGRVIELGESFITVEIAPNVQIKVQKGAISQVLPKGTLKSA
ncbi:preprotein translocase subunit YajC [Oleiagrimonas sp. C23AA]|uniref:preprotein translocase subunit YajC n=1 Tax=Oleiagrimonas sp. C23AA TaxID=2719047 RepID=UPI00141E638A|nr:preprotein translocase subunit YajC [Oleiagrimonas sp. C23AA]NII11504.1 preprotein translocase subunit YajC [Oleiagrimonas sp. C23AA]